MITRRSLALSSVAAISCAGCKPASSIASGTEAKAAPVARSRSAGNAMAAPGTLTQTIGNAGRGTLAAAPVVFGMAFQKGELAAGETFRVSASGIAAHEAQTDIHNTYSDGSARFAIITCNRPALGPGSTTTLTLTKIASRSPGEVSLASLLAPRTLTLTISGISHTPPAKATTRLADYTLDIKRAVLDAIASPSADPTNETYWQRGPLCTKICFEKRITGTGMRLCFEVAVFADGGIELDYTPRNDVVFYVTPEPNSYGRFEGTHSIAIDGTTVYSGSVSQALMQCWHRHLVSPNTVQRWPHDTGALYLVPNRRQLKASAAVLPFSDALPPREHLLARVAQRFSDPNWNRPLYAPGASTNDFAAAGDKNEIGLPDLTGVLWLQAGDPRAQRASMGSAEWVGILPYHYWDEYHRRYCDKSFNKRLDARSAMQVDFHVAPGKPTDAMAETVSNTGPLINYAAFRTEVNGTDNRGIGMTLDAQHIPQLCMMPFLMTGAKWLHDHLMAWASLAMVGDWNDVYHHDKHYAKDYDVILQNQVDGQNSLYTTRAQAWTIANIAEAAYAARGGSHYASYWKSMVDKQFDAWHRAYPSLYAGQGGDDPDAIHRWPDTIHVQWGTFQLPYLVYTLYLIGRRYELNDPIRPYLNEAMQYACKYYGNFPGKTDLSVGNLLRMAQPFRVGSADSKAQLITTWTQMRTELQRNNGAGLWPDMVSGDGGSNGWNISQQEHMSAVAALAKWFAEYGDAARTAQMRNRYKQFVDLVPGGVGDYLGAYGSQNFGELQRWCILLDDVFDPFTNEHQRWDEWRRGRGR